MYFIVVVVIWIEMNTAWRTYMCGHACAHESTPKSKSTRKYSIEYLSILIRKTSQNSLIHITYTSISIGISFNLLRFFFHRYSSQLSPLNFHCMAAFAVSSYIYLYIYFGAFDKKVQYNNNNNVEIVLQIQETHSMSTLNGKVHEKMKKTSKQQKERGDSLPETFFTVSRKKIWWVSINI